MKILSIDYNQYNRSFVSIEIEPNEQCKCVPYIKPVHVDFFPNDKSGGTHHIQVKRRYFTTGLTGQGLGYGSTWAVGNGSGASMGWTLGLSYEAAMNTARGFCAAIECLKLPAMVSFDNVKSDFEAYNADRIVIEETI